MFSSALPRIATVMNRSMALLPRTLRPGLPRRAFGLAGGPSSSVYHPLADTLVDFALSMGRLRPLGRGRRIFATILAAHAARREGVDLLESRAMSELTAVIVATAAMQMRRPTASATVSASQSRRLPRVRRCPPRSTAPGLPVVRQGARKSMRPHCWRRNGLTALLLIPILKA